MTAVPDDTPDGLGDGGRRLWGEMTTEFEFDEHELAQLLTAARTVDHLDALAELVAAGGENKLEAMREHRLQGLALARMLAALRLPEETPTATGQARVRRHQRRGIRGVYSA